MLYNQEAIMCLYIMMKIIVITAWHIFFSLNDKDFDVSLSSIICWLKEVQEMNSYLRTGFGDYKGSYCEKNPKHFKGI